MRLLFWYINTGENVAMNKILVIGLLTSIALIPAAIAQTPLDQLIHTQNYEARRCSSSNADLNKNGDGAGIKPGATRVLMDEDGPGIVTHFWNTVAAYDPFSGRSLVLRVFYDHLEKPSVEAPLGDFFGVGHGAQKNFTSLPVTASSHGRSRTCYWRMPFQKHIKITVTNESPTYDVDSFYYYIDWQKHVQLPQDTTYFHAHYRQQHPAQPGNYTILETQGKGHYVGTVYSVHQMETGWFGEGDDFFYIDGAKTPQLRGTGTEDYFNDAWGFREFYTPYHGVTLYEGVLTGDRVSAYRWHIQDPIPFNQSLRLDIEHKGSVFNDRANLLTSELGSFLERPDWVSSVAFWYQTPVHTFDTPLPPVETRIPPYTVLLPSNLTYRADPPFLVIPQNPFLIYAPNQPNATIEFDFEVQKDGRYRIDAVFLYSVLAGVYQPYLDNVPLGKAIDFVLVNHDPVWDSLDTHDLKAGKHTLKFVGQPQIPAQQRALMPKLNGFGLAALTLLRLDDMEGYNAVLHTKTNPEKTPKN